MEIHIQDLVSSIKKEGIDAARIEADGILADAQKKADSIISEARAEAKKTQEAAAKEIELLKQGAIVSAEQAKRDPAPPSHKLGNAQGGGAGGVQTDPGF